MLKLASLFVAFAEAERPVVYAEAQAFWNGRGRDLLFRAGAGAGAAVRQNMSPEAVPAQVALHCLQIGHSFFSAC